MIDLLSDTAGRVLGSGRHLGTAAPPRRGPLPLAASATPVLV
jgi:hypothetical protein